MALNQVDNYGNSGLTLRADSGVDIDKVGLWTATMRWSCPQGQEAILKPALFSAHPDYDIMFCENVRFWRAEGWGWIEAAYAGAELSQITADGVNGHSYELIQTTAEEPIATHPKFKTDLAGDATTPKNGAYFDPQTKKFVGFTTAPTNALYGVESYLDASQMTWRHSYLAKSPPSGVSDVGTITDPDGTPPSLGTGRNWLFTSLQYERRGYVYSITKDWRASGKRGWNTTIYET